MGRGQFCVEHRLRALGSISRGAAGKGKPKEGTHRLLLG